MARLREMWQESEGQPHGWRLAYAGRALRRSAASVQYKIEHLGLYREASCRGPGEPGPVVARAQNR